VALVLAEFGEPVVGPEGRAFRAKACALPTKTGLWQGWIEFNPTNGAPTFRSPQETTQPSRVGVVNWAGGLTPNYLEAALDRALFRIKPTPQS
jgi:hypothetical protein